MDRCLRKWDGVELLLVLAVSDARFASKSADSPLLSLFTEVTPKTSLLHPLPVGQKYDICLALKFTIERGNLLQMIVAPYLFAFLKKKRVELECQTLLFPPWTHLLTEDRKEDSVIRFPPVAQ